MILVVVGAIIRLRRVYAAHFFLAALVIGVFPCRFGLIITTIIPEHVCDPFLLSAIIRLLRMCYHPVKINRLARFSFMALECGFHDLTADPVQPIAFIRVRLVASNLSERASDPPNGK